METILGIIWFVGIIGSIILTMIAIMWPAEKRDDAYFKAMSSNSLVEWQQHRVEWNKRARITMGLLYSALGLSIISIIAIISAIFV